MIAIYANMHSNSEKISFPNGRDLGDKSCALFEIMGKVSPYTDKPLFLCTDFIETSVMGWEQELPVLRRVVLIRRKEGDGARIQQIPKKMLWVPTNRNVVEEIRLYLTDEKGNLAPFEECDVSCTLVCIPRLN